MKKTIYILLFMLFTLTVSQAQSLSQAVVSTSGNTINGASNTLSFTIGEPIIGAISNGEKLGQGFWLGAIEEIVLSNDDFTFEVTTTVYPNPVTDYLTINFKDMVARDFEIVIHDMNGKVILQKKVENNVNSETINFYNYNQGIYLLTIVQSATVKSKTFKIIKK
ncbi:T9SS type A sorting domain-containing protein [Ulvibacter litoralis]|uniref:Por secretion system C-terminal sorting domain-containing protein n=1 Tax=Ulvibacter litoralis TaxID=227084 RepID=A0A1G7GIR1_9FLAO|nr:T9SS type A sorting domain-containing protein [Ulvibacter litoralis]GHC56018.1 hypothetical protein GCM10008083_20580 [Ulvibacter litoralis]SDE88027.1 Por secretion system C-terminal sorting domain-containing protein [Ulvibacter litoralis]